MVTISSGKVVISVSAVLAGLNSLAELAVAGDHGYSYTSRVTQHGSLIAAPPMAVVNYGAYQPQPTYSYAPMMMSGYPVYHLQAQPAVTHYSLAPNVVYYTTYAVPAVAGQVPVVSPTFTNPALATPSIGPASANYLSEYTNFLKDETLKNPATIYRAAGVQPTAYEVTANQQNHPQLVALLGADRLASISRFLITKRNEPNFRANAVQLFEPLLGVFLPQYLPQIQHFLDDLGQRPGSSTTNPDDRVPPAPFVPPVPPVKKPTTLLEPVPATSTPSLKKDTTTGHFIHTASDGTETEYDENMKPIATTSADGKVTKL